jgi:hypothetical protein
MQKTLKSLFSIERWRNTKNSSIVDNESIRPKFSEFIYWQTELCPEPKEIHISALFIARRTLIQIIFHIYL